jgi:Spx/MgsR family transcriptional regulator
VWEILNADLGASDVIDWKVIMYVRISDRSATQPLSCGGESMAELEIFLYASCTSCRKAEELLREKGIDAKRRDYFKERFTKPELIAVLDLAGVTPFDVLSARSNPYRELGLAEQTLTENELLDLMVTHPQLLKRPLIVKNGHSTVGFNRGAIEALIEE